MLSIVPSITSIWFFEIKEAKGDERIYWKFSWKANFEIVWHVVAAMKSLIAHKYAHKHK